MWLFEGSGASIVPTEAESGNFQIYGDLTSQSFPAFRGDDGFDQVSKAKHLDFCVVTPDADETDINIVAFGNIRGLFERFRAEPNRSHAMIYYSPDEHRARRATVYQNTRLAGLQRRS